MKFLYLTLVINVWSFDEKSKGKVRRNSQTSHSTSGANSGAIPKDKFGSTKTLASKNTGFGYFMKFTPNLSAHNLTRRCASSSPSCESSSTKSYSTNDSRIQLQPDYYHARRAQSQLPQPPRQQHQQHYSRRPAISSHSYSINNLNSNSNYVNIDQIDRMRQQSEHPYNSSSTTSYNNNNSMYAVSNAASNFGSFSRNYSINQNHAHTYDTRYRTERDNLITFQKYENALRLPHMPHRSHSPRSHTPQHHNQSLHHHQQQPQMNIVNHLVVKLINLT